MKQRLKCAMHRLWADRGLWVCAGVLVLLFYNMYLGQHYSPDTWSTAQYFKDIDAAGHTLAEKWALLYEPFAQQGRFVRGLIMFLLGVPNISSLMVSRFANGVALALFVCAFVCCYKMLRCVVAQRGGALSACTGHGGALSENAKKSGAQSAKAQDENAKTGNAQSVNVQDGNVKIGNAQDVNVQADVDGAQQNGGAQSATAPHGTTAVSAVCPKRTAVVCFLGTAVLLCNPFFCDWLQFAECALIYPLGLLLAVLAARVLVTQWPVVLRVGASAVLVVLAAGIYQITLQFFVLFVMLAAVLRALCGTHAQSGKRMAKDAAVLAAQALFAYLCAVGSQYLFTSVLYQSPRISTDFAAALSLISAAQRELWSMQYLGAGNSLFMLCVVVLAVLAVAALLWGVATKRLSPMALAVSGVAFAAYYASVFVMMLVANGSIPHRTVVGFFGIPLFLALCLVGALHFAPQSAGRVPWNQLAIGTATAVLCVLLCFNWYHTQRLSLGLVRSNAQDIALAREMQQCIVQYEQTTGTVVSKVAFHRMPGFIISYPDAFQSHDLNLRAWSAQWSLLPMLNTVNGTAYGYGVLSDTIVAQHFAQREWTAFSSEQVVCEGDTAYIALY